MNDRPTVGIVPLGLYFVNANGQMFDKPDDQLVQDLGRNPLRGWRLVGETATFVGLIAGGSGVIATGVGAGGAAIAATWVSAGGGLVGAAYDVYAAPECAGASVVGTAAGIIAGVTGAYAPTRPLIFLSTVTSFNASLAGAEGTALCVLGRNGGK